MKRIFTNLQASPFTAECEECGWDMNFTGVVSAEGEGRFGTCHHCGVTENTWVDSEEIVLSLVMGLNEEETMEQAYARHHGVEL